MDERVRIEAKRLAINAIKERCKQRNIAVSLISAEDMEAMAVELLRCPEGQKFITQAKEQ